MTNSGRTRASAMCNILYIGGLVALLMAFFERPAQAYTDPGALTMIWQMLVATAIGAAIYFRRFVGWLSRRKNRRTESE